jgi:predicted CoA-binding protein
MILRTAAERSALFDRVKTVAVVGASNNPLRPSYTVFSYLRTRTPYRVTPINPMVAALDGVKGYPSVAAYAAEHGPPDVVDVFRKPSEVLAVVDDAIAAGARAIWFQYGIVNEDAIARADAGGLDVVVDRCMKVEHARFHGGLSATGLNSGVISSRLAPPPRS